jgi:hypothetical protein
VAATWAGALALSLLVQRLAPHGVAGIALKLGVLAACGWLVVKGGLWKEAAGA